MCTRKPDSYCLGVLPMESVVASVDTTEASKHEPVGCAWAFVGMFGIFMGWMLSCGSAITLIFIPVEHSIYIPERVSSAVSTLAFAALAVIAAFIFGGSVWLTHRSLVCEPLPQYVLQRWRWATFLGGLAYWFASLALLWMIGQTDTLGLVPLLNSDYSDVFAQALTYLAVALLGALAGAAAMALLCIPQYLTIRRYVPRANRWPIYMMLANALPVSLLYLALTDVWRYGGWN
jgi:hypothetical protein